MQSLRPISSTLLQTATRIPTISQFSCRTANRTTHRRTFLTNPFAGPQHLTASRTLDYPAKTIYAIIADINSYSTFLPYCQHSQVTKRSAPASDGNTYPEEAQLVVGFNGDVSETFTSRVYCVPETLVEAVSGQAQTALSPDDITHHSPRSSSEASTKDTVMSRLVTRWTLLPFPHKPLPTAEQADKNNSAESEPESIERTQVSLNIEYQFANPVYAALSSAAAPKVADKMIEAFENRVKSVVEGKSQPSR
ncbi:hypothetical protein LTR08_007500 [Meristemomyces frigidus]|nr:hypothetical protein LTR08_007500 [Meristemomyces frigidus]